MKSRTSPTAYAVKQGQGLAVITKQRKARQLGGGGCAPPATLSTLSAMPRTCTPTAPSATTLSTTILPLSAPLCGSIWNLISSDL